MGSGPARQFRTRAKSRTLGLAAIATLEQASKNASAIAVVFVAA
jgi:hypothetical protein